MSQTADRYAKALFELAGEQNELDAVENSLSEIRKLINALEDFRQFLGNPLLTFEERRTVLTKLFYQKVPDLVFNFLLFITYKGRLVILKDIIHSFDAMYLSYKNQVRAYVTTALAINDEEKAFIDRRLQEKFKQETLSQWKVDPSLIGGFRIFVQGKVYDYSFKNQLNKFYQEATQPL